MRAQLVGQGRRQAQVEANPDHCGVRRPRHQFDQDAGKLAPIEQHIVRPLQLQCRSRPASADFMQREHDREPDRQRQARRRGTRREAPEHGEGQAVAGCGKPSATAPAAPRRLIQGDQYTAMFGARFGFTEQTSIGRVAGGLDLDREGSVSAQCSAQSGGIDHGSNRKRWNSGDYILKRRRCAGPPSHAMYVNPATLRVYLLEPSAAQSRLIAGMLTRAGCADIQFFERAADLLTACSSTAPGLIVSTFYPPDLEGDELIRRLRADPQSAAIPFILISSETRSELLEPIRQGGACAILAKPFSAAELDTALGAVLDYLDDTPLELPGLDVDRLRVLLVDDSGSARRFTRRVLENLGLRQFHEAADGLEAIAALEANELDLVVTDLNMPRADGCQLTEFIRQRSWQRELPVLMLTSDQDPQRLAAVRAAGISALGGKPLTPAFVKATLTRLLGRR